MSAEDSGSIIKSGEANPTFPNVVPPGAENISTPIAESSDSEGGNSQPSQSR